MTGEAPDGRAFDELMAVLDPAMVVVTVGVAGERDGCLVGFHSQCGIDPRRYAVWLSRANRTFELAADATHLAVHLLGQDDRELAELFGGETGDEVDKLAGLAWEPGPGGAPLLERLPNRFVGRVVERLEADADHLCVVLEPVEAAVAVSGPPLRLGAITDIDAGHEADERR